MTECILAHDQLAVLEAEATQLRESIARVAAELEAERLSGLDRQWLRREDVVGPMRDKLIVVEMRLARLRKVPIALPTVS